MLYVWYKTHTHITQTYPELNMRWGLQSCSHKSVFYSQQNHYFAFLVLSIYNSLISSLQYRKSWKMNFYRTTFFQADRKLYEILGTKITALLLVYICCQYYNYPSFSYKCRYWIQKYSKAGMILTPWLLAPSAWKEICTSEGNYFLFFTMVPNPSIFLSRLIYSLPYYPLQLQ